VEGAQWVSGMLPRRPWAAALAGDHRRHVIGDDG
jgi:hypothetical protein